MKKALLVCVLAVLGSLVGWADKTVYFQKPSGVASSTIKIYAWGNNDVILNGDWPGKLISGNTETIDGVEYLVELVQDEAVGIIFNWNSGNSQTSNIEPVDKGVYYASGEVKGKVVNGHLVVPAKVRFYFDKPNDWNNVFIYSWTGDYFGSWPGTKITDNTEVINGKTYYYVEVNEGTNIGEGFKFSNGSGGETENFYDGYKVNGIYNKSSYVGTTDDIGLVDGSKIYFKNDLDWKTVYAYAWSGSGDNVKEYNGAYPGNALTETTDINGETVYVANFVGAEKIIFSCFDESHTHLHSEAHDWEKTSDLNINPGFIYKASNCVINNKPEYVYVIGGKGITDGWDINDESRKLSPNSEDSSIYTGWVTVTEDEFRFYTALGDWDSNTWGSSTDGGFCQSITLKQGKYTGKVVKGQGKWKMPQGSKGKNVFFTFNFHTKEFSVYDPSVVTVNDLLEGDEVVPAPGEYDNKDAFVKAGDNDGLARIQITLDTNVHINRDFEGYAVLKNNNKEVFKVSAQMDPAEINDNNKIGIHSIGGNSSDGGTDLANKFEFVFSADATDVLAYQGETTLVIPDGFFMYGGEVEYVTTPTENGDVVWEKWTGGTSVKGSTFLWDVKEGARLAVEPLTNTGNDDVCVVDKNNTLTLTLNKYEHKADATGENPAHITITQNGEESPLYSIKTKEKTVTRKLNPGRAYSVNYHYHAYTQTEESINPDDYVKDDDNVKAENTLFVYTHPEVQYYEDENTVVLKADEYAFVLYSFDPTINFEDYKEALLEEMPSPQNSKRVYKAPADDEEEAPFEFVQFNENGEAALELPEGTGTFAFCALIVKHTDDVDNDYWVMTDKQTLIIPVESKLAFVEGANYNATENTIVVNAHKAGDEGTDLDVTHHAQFGGSNATHYGAVSVTHNAESGVTFSTLVGQADAGTAKLNVIATEPGEYTVTLTHDAIKDGNNNDIFKASTKSVNLVVLPTPRSAQIVLNGHLIDFEKTSTDLHAVVDPDVTFVNEKGTAWDPKKGICVENWGKKEIELYYTIVPATQPASYAPSVVRREESAAAQTIYTTDGMTKYEGKTTNGLNTEAMGLTSDSTSPAQVKLQVVQNGVVGAPHTVNIYAANNDVTTGVEEAVSADVVEAVYYDLNGVKVNAEKLVPGIYVVVRGDKSEKVLVK